MMLTNAKVAQLVEHDLAKVGVASSSLVSRSRCGFEHEKSGNTLKLKPTFFATRIEDDS
jgi:hypothetical protein